MSVREILCGSQSFRDLRENNNVYIDKTGFICELFSDGSAKVSIITRPRRFGKSLLLDMLREFFDWTKDSSKLFDGLAVSEDKELCAKWMNKYPVIYLSLNEMKGDSFEKCYNRFKMIAGRLCEDFNYLLYSSKVGEFYKIFIKSIQTVNAERGALYSFIMILCRAIYQNCGIKPVILIDDYDAPLSKIKGEKDYKKMASSLDSFFESSLKSNHDFAFAILTGSLPYTTAGITSGFNNYVIFDMNDLSFADKFGFTQTEVQSLLADQGFSDKMDKVQEWYGGYCFGSNQLMYCPWDVMNYLYDLKVSPDTQPATYWKNASSNDAVEYCLDNYMERFGDKISALLNHRFIDAAIRHNLICKPLCDSEENLWTLLYLAGYLTKIPDSQEEEDYTALWLRIPNREIFTIFTQTIESAFRKRVEDDDSLPLVFDAFWNREDQTVSEMLSALFLKAIHFHDYVEVFWPFFLAGLFQAKYPHTTSNYKSGPGSGDIIIKDPDNNRAAVIEIKRSDTNDAMTSAAETALRQIAGMRYDAPLQGDYPLILHWGIECHDKSCVAKSVAG